MSGAGPVLLPGGGATTRLGFGCGGIGGSGEAEGRVRLTAALDAGIRHFDVAPSYGLGLAEDVLGRFLRGCGEEVTITTKAGIGRPPAQKFISLARNAVKPFLSHVPGLKRHLGNRVRQMAPRALFGVADIQASLEESLRRLGRERVDLFLMHEITQEDVNDELRYFLDERKRAGVIGAYGIGSRRPAAEALAASTPAFAQVVQTDWCTLDAPLDFPQAQLLNTHGALRRLSEVAERIAHENLSELVGVDLAAPGVLANVLLGAALAHNPNGIVLVASSQLQRLAQLALAAQDHSWRSAGRTLTEVLKSGVV